MLHEFMLGICNSPSAADRRATLPARPLEHWDTRSVKHGIHPLLHLQTST